MGPFTLSSRGTSGKLSIPITPISLLRACKISHHSQLCASAHGYILEMSNKMAYHLNIRELSCISQETISPNKNKRNHFGGTKVIDKLNGPCRLQKIAQCARIACVNRLCSSSRLKDTGLVPAVKRYMLFFCGGGAWQQFQEKIAKNNPAVFPFKLEEWCSVLCNRLLGP